MVKYRVEANPIQFELKSTNETDAGRPFWTLETSIKWEFWADDLKLIDSCCPVGMKTDLGSIPRALSSIVSGNDVWNIAYILHDQWCNEKWLNSDLASELLYAACVRFGCPSWKAFIIYESVKNFGPKWTGGINQIKEVDNANS